METGQGSSANSPVEAPDLHCAQAAAQRRRPFEDPDAPVEKQPPAEDPENAAGPSDGGQATKPAHVPKNDKGKIKSVKRLDRKPKSLNEEWRLDDEHHPLRKHLFLPLIGEVARKVGRATHWQSDAVTTLAEAAGYKLMRFLRGEED